MDPITITLPRAFAIKLLEEAISDFSESCWCAGWMHDIQHDLWRILEFDGFWSYGMCAGGPDDSRIEFIRLLRDQTGMWFCDYEQVCTVEEYRAQLVARNDE